MAAVIHLPAGLKVWAAPLCALGALVLTDISAEAQGLQTGEVFRDQFVSGDGHGPEMAVLPAGLFAMGSKAFEEYLDNDEGPMRTVEIGYRLAVGRYPVTVDEFSAFAEAAGWTPDGGCLMWFSGRWRLMPEAGWRSPGYDQTGDHPVTCISWDDAQAYVDWLNLETGLAGRADRYRLLSEAEWEYAARAGADSDYSFGDDDSALIDHAWFAGNAHDSTQPAGAKRPNAFGLHDMHGNVWEWVEDCYSDTYEESPSDGSPQIIADCPDRSVRGGAWDSDPERLRAAQRSAGRPHTRVNNTGLRVARTLPD